MRLQAFKIMEELFNEEMYALVAPDGSVQLGSINPDFPTCVAWIRMLHKVGMGKSFHELSMKGFKILPVKITVTKNGDENKPFQK